MIEGKSVVTGRTGSGTSSWTVGEMPVGVAVLPRELDSEERRRMKRPARDFFLSLVGLLSSPETELSVSAEGDRTLSLSRLNEERRLLMESRLFCCVDGGRVGDREAAGAADSLELVKDLRCSLMKSLTTLSEDRRALSSLLPLFDPDPRRSLDMRRS